MAKRSVSGTHNPLEWKLKKQAHNYRCASCGVSEHELSIKYGKTQFTSLTKDHILPLAEGGTDNIGNILPLCYACNAKKNDPIRLERSKNTLFKNIVSFEELAALRSGLGRVVCASCPADPLHPGHVSYLVDSKNFGDTLVVIVNGDWFLRNKKGASFHSLETRCQIISSIKAVDFVVPYEIENDTTVCQALEQIRPHVFTKGGDRTNRDNIPEWDTCEKNGIRLVTEVGDPKVHSSSDCLQQWVVNYNSRQQKAT